MKTEITNGKIPSGIKSVVFVSFRVANTWVHEDKVIINEDGDIWTLRGSSAANNQGYCRIKIATGDFWTRETNATNKKEFTPECAFVLSTSRIDSLELNVHVPGLRFCPFSGTFWERGHWDKEWEPEAKKWDAWFFSQIEKNARFALALKLSATLIYEPNFKIRHHPFYVPDLKKRMEVVFRREHIGRYYDDIKENELRAFLKLERPKPEKPQILKSITRHIRTNARFLTRSTISFFRMFAGAAAINKALKYKTNEQNSNPKIENTTILRTHSSRN